MRDTSCSTSWASSRARSSASSSKPSCARKSRSRRGRFRKATSRRRSARWWVETRELDQICSTLRGGETRLLTLTGPGGAGKTRLAIEASNALAEEIPDGAFFVSLDTIRDPALLLPAIAQALAVRESAERPLLQSLAERVVGRRALVLLDNFEQLIEAAPLLTNVLEAAPSLTFLVTSRAALRLSGEREYPVEPLGRQDAVTLFVERAQAAEPSFRLTDENARGRGRDLCAARRPSARARARRGADEAPLSRGRCSSVWTSDSTS